jgi:hypothetical protein
MTTPGVGPVVALTYRATVDVPARFRKSQSVGAVFGLTSSRYQSGEIDWSGSISRCGDEFLLDWRHSHRKCQRQLSASPRTQQPLGRDTNACPARASA